MKTVPLPDKITPTDFLLELNNILKDNTTLEEMKIQSGLFLPLSVSAGGLGGGGGTISGQDLDLFNSSMWGLLLVACPLISRDRSHCQT